MCLGQELLLGRGGEGRGERGWCGSGIGLASKNKEFMHNSLF